MAQMVSEYMHNISMWSYCLRKKRVLQSHCDFTCETYCS